MRLVTRLSHPCTPDPIDFVRLNRAVPVSAGVVLATGRRRMQPTIHFLKNLSIRGGPAGRGGHLLTKDFDMATARQRAPAKRKRTITNMPKRTRRALGKQGAAVAKRKRTGGRTPKTRAELYEEAKRRNLPGRSKMGRAELARALGHK
jgi:hypothetical protein